MGLALVKRAKLAKHLIILIEENWSVRVHVHTPQRVSQNPPAPRAPAPRGALQPAPSPRPGRAVAEVQGCSPLSP